MALHSRPEFDSEHPETVAVADILAHGLRVVFCGLNPGLSSAAQGLPFANPTNRFWRVMHLVGFTPSMLTPAESQSLLQYGCGLTTAVRRPTVASSELAPSEFADGADALRGRIRTYAPAHVAFMGKAAYRIIERPSSIDWGEQRERFAGARAWVLPNTSGLSRFTLDALVAAYRPLHDAAFGAASAHGTRTK
jgi:double-stranded uracil-DNA glycosylase